MNMITRNIRPGLDELVPSRYALQVGDIDVLVVSDGVITPPAAAMATNVDPAVRAAWLDDMFLPPDVFDWALNAVVVRSGVQTILIDAGLGLEYPDFPRAGQLAHRLEAAGIDLSSVTDVVLTHMHFDHVGGLLVDEVRDRLRPDLRVHVAAAEAKFWESPDFSRTAMPPQMAELIRRAAKRFLNEYHGQLAAVREGVRGGAGCTGLSHRRPHTRTQRGPLGVRRRQDDVRRRRGVSGQFRTPGMAQRIRTRPRGGGPGSDPSSAGVGGEPRVAGGHAPAVPVRLPCGGRRRRLSLGTGGLGLLAAFLLSAAAFAQTTRKSTFQSSHQHGS